MAKDSIPLMNAPGGPWPGYNLIHARKEESRNRGENHVIHEIAEGITVGAGGEGSNPRPRLVRIFEGEGLQVDPVVQPVILVHQVVGHLECQPEVLTDFPDALLLLLPRVAEQSNTMS